MKPLLLFVPALLLACTRGVAESDMYIETNLILSTADDTSTRAASPDETMITDYNIFIFNLFGDLEESAYLKGRHLEYHTRLLRNVPYTILAAANMGYQLPIRCLSDAREYRYPMAYPDEYREGLPMAAVLEEVTVQEQMPLRLERLMARIDLQMDRRALAAGTLVKVTDVIIGNGPSSVSLFPVSCMETAAQAFQQGFSLHNDALEALNRDHGDGLSGTVSLYLLENGSETHQSYVEIRAEYHSDTYHTAPLERLVYRIPLGRVVRNTVYPQVVRIMPR